jgi:flagellar biogenesis protein FliO
MTSSYGWAVFETMLTLLGVCLLAVVSLKWLAKRGIGVGTKSTEMSVLDRIPLDARRSLVLVEVRGRTLLLGLGESGAPTMLAEMDGTRVTRTFRDALSQAHVEEPEINRDMPDRRSPDDQPPDDRRRTDT